MCGAVLTNSKGKMVKLCLYSNTKNHNPELCWKTKSSRIQSLFVDSMFKAKHLHAEKITVLTTLFRILSSAAEESDHAFKMAFSNMSSNDRNLLITFSVDELRYLLLKITAENKLNTRTELKKYSIPEELPEDFKQLLTEYQEKFIKRYSILISKGHSRSREYSKKEMALALKFVRYLTNQGYSNWLQVGQTQVVNFIQDENTRFSYELRHFLKFARDQRNPFKKRKSGKPKKNASALTSTPLPKVLSPKIVTQLLEQIENDHGDAAFALAWLVCRMGLTLTAAFQLPLSRIMINDQDECVIKPNEVWISVPEKIKKILTSLIEAHYPNWQTIPDKTSEYFTIFPYYIEDKSNFGMKILHSQTKELRSSAILALMKKGYQDRITLHKAIGVSMPTIVKLECLLPVDTHRKLDPELIKARNAVILGEDKDG